MATKHFPVLSLHLPASSAARSIATSGKVSRVSGRRVAQLLTRNFVKLQRSHMALCKLTEELLLETVSMVKPEGAALLIP